MSTKCILPRQPAQLLTLALPGQLPGPRSSFLSGFCLLSSFPYWSLLSQCPGLDTKSPTHGFSLQHSISNISQTVSVRNCTVIRQQTLTISTKLTIHPFATEQRGFHLPLCFEVWLSSGMVRVLPSVIGSESRRQTATRNQFHPHTVPTQAHAPVPTYSHNNPPV